MEGISTINTKPFQKTILMYLTLFLVFESLWLLTDLIGLALSRNDPKDFSPFFLHVELFVLGIMISVVIATAFAKKLFDPLRTKLVSGTQIYVRPSMFTCTSYPYAPLNALLCVSILLAFLQNNGFPFFKLEDIGNIFHCSPNDCKALINLVEAFILGVGTGISSGALIWIRKSNNS